MSKTSIVFIDTPPEHALAFDTAWRRARQLLWGLPPLFLEALKPSIISVYMQGLVDGYDVKTREMKRGEKKKRGGRHG